MSRRRALLAAIGTGIGGLSAGVVLGRNSVEVPERKNWREQEYNFWLDVNDWVEKLGGVDYTPNAWQCCARFLAPDSVGKAIYLRRPKGEDEWEYRIESQSNVSSVYQRLPEERNQELTDKYGDARRVTVL